MSTTRKLKSGQRGVLSLLRILNLITIDILILFGLVLLSLNIGIYFISGLEYLKTVAE